MTTKGKNQETERGNRPQNCHLTGSAIAPGLAEGKSFVYRDILSQGEVVSVRSTPNVDVEHARLDEARELGIARIPSLVAMIETPAAALSVSDILRSADAISIGNKDLTQYVMAAGRQNPLANEYFREDHPAMMRLIRIIFQDSGGSTVGMCGELAGRPQAIPELLHAGIRLFSVAP